MFLTSMEITGASPSPFVVEAKSSISGKRPVSKACTLWIVRGKSVLMTDTRRGCSGSDGVNSFKCPGCDDLSLISVEDSVVVVEWESSSRNFSPRRILVFCCVGLIYLFEILSEFYCNEWNHNIFTSKKNQ